jgi:hypothetical protein
LPLVTDTGRSFSAVATELITVLVAVLLIPKIKVLRPLSQAAAYNHPNILTFTLLLLGQTGKAWEPSYNEDALSPAQ